MMQVNSKRYKPCTFLSGLSFEKTQHHSRMRTGGKIPAVLALQTKHRPLDALEGARSNIPIRPVSAIE